MKSDTKICPFCFKDFPLEQLVCECGAYRVNDENYNKKMKNVLNENDDLSSE
jgi:hypothetical protein